MPAQLLTLLFLIGTLNAPAPGSDVSRELTAMADTERAFARTCVEKGLREAFLAFFDEEGVTWNPGPMNIREVFPERPESAGRPRVTLDWEPIYGDIAGAADLGYLTGPFLVTDHSLAKRPPEHGYYFSVWKKQADGSWRVVADMGIQIPGGENKLQRDRLERAPSGISLASGATEAGERIASLRSAEAELAKDLAENDPAEALLARLDENARLHRESEYPLTTRESIRGHLKAHPQGGEWETSHAEVSGSDDLGYTYGHYRWARAAGTVREGFYLRVWRRDGEAHWKIVADVTKELPESE